MGPKCWARCEQGACPRPGLCSAHTGCVRVPALPLTVWGTGQLGSSCNWPSVVSPEKWKQPQYMDFEGHVRITQDSAWDMYALCA